jgi:bacterioferritin-associated ferredoxin
LIVCVCKFVSARAIRVARDAGARSLEAVARATGAGTGCGCCHEAIEKVLAEPCRPEPCAACPNRAPSPDGVPGRVAAAGVKTP